MNRLKIIVRTSIGFHPIFKGISDSTVKSVTDKVCKDLNEYFYITRKQQPVKRILIKALARNGLIT